MARLFDLLRAEGAWFPDGTEVIIGDAVWTEIDKGETQEWQTRDFPNVAPPFKTFFVEARSNFNEMSAMMLGGLHFQEAEPDILAKVQGSSTWIPPQSEAKWVMYVTAYAHIGGTCYTLPGCFFVHIGEHGEWLDNPKRMNVFITEEYRDKPTSYWITKQALPVHDSMNYLPFVLKTLAVMHCKNVSTVVETPVRQQRRHFERKHKVTLCSYHVLKIKPIGSKSESSDKPTAAVGLNRQHIARGHFKTYTDEAPLFGKFTGTYWWESHVRGKADKGEVKKDYEVLPE